MARQESVRENIGRLHHAVHEQCADTVEYCREPLDFPWQDKFDLVPQAVPTPVMNGRPGLARQCTTNVKHFRPASVSHMPACQQDTPQCLIRRSIYN
ncbi:hypothetical protein V6C53_02785 [Desulfocurvibacter africanus]|uniref:hypothetical protein n=1 Tax=Desulfocurvibacter africanus TaxID=873 RepID=UPI002FD8F40D